MKFLKILQYAYLVFFALFVYDTIVNWSQDRNRAYMSLFFAALALTLQDRIDALDKCLHTVNHASDISKEDK